MHIGQKRPRPFHSHETNSFGTMYVPFYLAVTMLETLFARDRSPASQDRNCSRESNIGVACNTVGSDFRGIWRHEFGRFCVNLILSRYSWLGLQIESLLGSTFQLMGISISARFCLLFHLISTTPANNTSAILLELWVDPN